MKILNKVVALKPEIIFVFIALCFGLFSALFVPQLSVSDEPAHFYRSYSISRASLVSSDCAYPQELIDKVGSTSKGVYSFDLSVKNSSELVSGSCGAAGNYYPTMHLPQSLGVLFAKFVYDSPSFMVFMGRITNLLFFIISVYLIIKYVVVGKWVFLVIGLLPASIHSAASLSYDTFNTVIILAFIAMLLNLFSKKRALSLKQISLLTLLSILLVTAKTSNAVILVTLLALPPILFTKSPLNTSRIANKILVLVSIFFISAIAIFAWQNIAETTISSMASVNRLSQNPLYFVVILYNTYVNPFLGYSDILVRGAVGDFSSFKYHLPTYMVIASYILIVFSLFKKDISSRRFLTDKSLKNLAVICAVAIFLSLMIITYGLYSLWATQPGRLGPNAIYADGVQGRYFTPLLALFIPICLWFKQYIFIGTSSAIIYNGVVIASSVSLLLFYSFQTILFIK